MPKITVSLLFTEDHEMSTKQCIYYFLNNLHTSFSKLHSGENSKTNHAPFLENANMHSET